MKKFLGVLAAGALMLGFSTAAHATYLSNDLIQVVIDTTSGYEMQTDLGQISNYDVTTGTYTFTGTDSLGLSGTHYTAGDSLLVGYFAAHYTSPVASDTIWTSGSGAAGGTETNLNYSGASSGVLKLAADFAYASTANAAASTWQANTSTGSYYYMMDKEGLDIGSFDLFYGSNPGDGDAALAVGTNAVQGMFYWATPTVKTSNNTASFLLTTSLNGTTLTVTGSAAPQAAAPIPPSALLLGSGLLGLIGIRRKTVFGI